MGGGAEEGLVHVAAEVGDRLAAVAEAVVQGAVAVEPSHKELVVPAGDPVVGHVVPDDEELAVRQVNDLPSEFGAGSEVAD